ncbi:MAG: hypothetical protein JWO62_3350 [Acidimicrobiaceae bacterium]|nr:hypothetical protein [Acidimicrobiaceae bacterium]
MPDDPSTEGSPWRRSDKFDPASRVIADRHYNRQKVGSPQFVRPARSLVLRSSDGGALWVSIAPKFQAHAWAGAWENETFRREFGGLLASDMIRLAVAHTLAEFGEPPELGMITMVDPKAVRHKRDPGRCYLKAGFRKVGMTKVRKRLVFQLVPANMPEPSRVPTDQGSFGFEAAS